MERPAAQGEDQGHDRPDVVVHGEFPAIINNAEKRLQRPRLTVIGTPQMLAAIGETYETDAGSKDMGEPSDDLVTGVIVNVRPAL